MADRIWVEVKDFPNYSVSNDGLVRNNKTGRLLKPRYNPNGYMKFMLYNNDGGKECLIHRLVAEAFIPNPRGKPTVDHIDRNKENNNVENLRWATRSEQMYNRAVKDGGTSIKVIAYRDNFSKEYASISECARDLGLHITSVSKCLLGKQCKSKGYTFKRVEVMLDDGL